MFVFISNAFKKIRKWYFRLKEATYSFVNFFGYKVEPGHFTKHDREKYKKWVTAHQALIVEKLTIDGKLPDYFELNESGGVNPAPKFKFKRPDYSYLSDYGRKPLCVLSKDILDKITGYLDKRYSRIGFIANNLNAKENKMTVDKMILLFLADFIKTQLINFDNRADELVKVKQLLEYVSKLTSDDLVKYDNEFHKVLCDIKVELKKASVIVSNKVELISFQSTTTDLETIISNFITNALSYLHNIFNFKNTDDIRHDHSPYDKWREAVVTINSPALKLEDINKTYLEDISKFVFSNSDYKQDNMCPVLLKLLTDLASTKQLIDKNITDFQNDLLNLILLNKVLKYLALSLASQREKVSTEQINKVHKYLVVAVGKLLENLQVMSNLRQNYDDYKDKLDVVGWQKDRLIKLQSDLEGLTKFAHELSNSLSVAKSIINYDNKPGKDTEKPDSKLEYYFDNILDLRLAIHNGLQQRNRQVVTDAVVMFLHDLRVDGKFTDDLCDVLSEYFILERNVEHKITAVDGDKIKLSDKPAYQYLNLLLTVFIKILKKDFLEQPEEKSTIISKFKTFLINNFMLNDQHGIEALFDYLTEVVSTAKDLEQQYSTLVQCIEKYLNSFEQQVTKAIMNMSTRRSDIFTPNSQLELTIKSEALSCNVKQDCVDYHDILAQDSFIAKLEKFTHNILHRIDREKIYYKLLTIRLEKTPLHLFTPEFTMTMYAKIKDFSTASSETNTILLNSIDLISNLVEAYTAFKKSYLLLRVKDKGATMVIDGSVDDTGIIKELLDKIIAKKQQLAWIQLDTKGIKTNIESQFISNERLALFEIKSEFKDYWEYIDSLKSIDVCFYNYLSCVSGSNFLLECAAVKCIYNIVREIEYESDPDKQNKLCIIIKSLFLHKNNFSDKLNGIISRLYESLSKKILVNKAEPLKLVMHKWGGGDLIKAVEEVNKQVSDHASVHKLIRT